MRDVFFRYSAQKSDIITTVSKYSKKSIIKHFKIREEKVYIIPNGLLEDFMVDYNKYECKQYIKNKYGIDDDYILYVSRIEPRKNHDLLLQAYLELELHNENIYLVFIGKSVIENKRFLYILNRLNDKQKKFVKLFDYVNLQDLIRFYCGASLFVYPSKAEGFGIPIIEALSLGVPTLCSNTTAMRELPLNADAFFDPYSIEDLKKKISLHFKKGIFSAEDLNLIKRIIRRIYNWNYIAKNFVNDILQV